MNEFEIINFDKNLIRLTLQDILEENGIPLDKDPGRIVKNTIYEAIDLFHENVKPSAVFKLVTKEEFKKIHYGEGLNSVPSPLEQIYTLADYLYVFVITVGSEINNLSNQLMSEDRLSLSYMLDSVGSAGVEKYADLLDSTLFSKHYQQEDLNKRVLRYSPGYCGWHLSSQRSIFDFLQPDKIGVKLSEGNNLP